MDPVSWHHAPAMGLAALLFAWVATVWRKMGTEELAARRTAMALRMRVLTLALSLVLNINGPPLTVTSLMAAVRSAGLFGEVLIAWGLRLKFRHHFPYQIVSTLAMMFLSTKEQCTKLMATSGAASAWFVARKLDSWAKRIMFAVYGRCSDEPLICPCLHVVVWFHVFGATILQTYMLRKLEQSSRRAFIRTLPEQRRRDEGLVVGFEDTLWTKVAHAFLFVFAFAVVWELNYFFVGAIDSWGV